MKIVVIGDTHIQDESLDLPDLLKKELHTADLIIHTGDIISTAFLKALNAIKPVKAVAGNMDCMELKNLLNEREEINIGSFKLGLTHGHGAPEKVLENVKNMFDDSFDLVLFGHSHRPINQKIGKTIFLNPGSPTDAIFAPYNSFGVITIDKTIKAEIIKL